MREPMDLQQLFMLYRHELGYSFVACIVACAKHWQKGDGFREIVTNGVICALCAFGIETLLDAFGISGGQWGYLASVFVGYVGVQSLMEGIAGRLPFLGGK